MVGIEQYTYGELIVMLDAALGKRLGEFKLFYLIASYLPSVDFTVADEDHAIIMDIQRREWDNEKSYKGEGGDADDDMRMGRALKLDYSQIGEMRIRCPRKHSVLLDHRSLKQTCHLCSHKRTKFHFCAICVSVWPTGHSVVKCDTPLRCRDSPIHAGLINNVFHFFGMQRACREPGGSTKQLAIKVKNEPGDNGSEIQKAPDKRKRKCVGSTHKNYNI